MGLKMFCDVNNGQGSANRASIRARGGDAVGEDSEVPHGFQLN